LEPRETETRKMHELEEYGLMHVKLYEDIARHGHIATAYAYPVKVEGRYVMDPSPIPRFDNPKLADCPAIQLFGAGREQRIYALPPYTRVVSLDFEDHPFEASKAPHDCDLCGASESYLDEVITDDAVGHRFLSQPSGGGACRTAWHRASSPPTPALPHKGGGSHQRHSPLPSPSWGGAGGGGAAAENGGRRMTDTPLLSVQALTKRYGPRIGCADVSFELYPGEVLGIVGESGSGKSTLLSCLAGHLRPDAGELTYDGRDVLAMSETDRRRLGRTEWAYVHQNPRDGLRMGVSAGGNVGERLMAVGARHYGDIRDKAIDWLGRVEIAADRIDDRPRAFSGGMQQRLQIARNLVTGPRLVFMDEPTGGLDVSVQARLLDLLRGLVREMGLSAIIVTHDLAVVRLLADRLMVMKGGHVVEQGLTDQVLDDPQHAYTQLLVSSVLQV
jgi:putative phosphonate transport system ATP-binding protein